MRLQFYIVLLLFMFQSTLIIAQNNSSQDIENEAKTARRNKNFDKAIELYEAAKANANDINKQEEMDEMIKQVREDRINYLNKLAKDAKDAQKKAEKNADAARKNAILAKEANTGMENALEKAKRAAKISEARRLASVANLEIKNENDSIALDSAYKALTYMKSLGEQIEQINLAFGDAVYHNMKKDLAEEHKGTITRLKYAPNGSSWFSVGRDSMLLLWEPKGNYSDLTKAINAQQGLILYATYSSDSQQILTCGSNGVAKVWKKGKLNKEFTGHTAHVLGGVFSKDGTKVLTWSRDNTAQLWTISGQNKAITLQHKGNVFAAQFSPDESKILTRSSDGTTKLWNSNGKFIATIEETPHYMFHASFSPNGRLITTSSGNNHAKIKDLLGKELATLSHKGIVKHIQFSKDGSKILSIGLDSLVNIWSKNGKLVMPLKHSDAIQSAVFSSYDQQVVTSTKNGQVIVWDLTKNGQAKKLNLNQEIIACQLHPTNQRILVYANDEKARLLDMEGHLLMTIPHKGVTPPIFNLAGDAIIATSNGRTLETIPLPSFVAAQLKFADKHQ